MIIQKLCALSSCKEPAEEKCHVKDAAVLREEYLQSYPDASPKQIEDYVDFQNVIEMCPNHHRIYFDRIKGPKHQKKLLYIDHHSKIFVIADATTTELDTDKCYIIPFRRNELLKDEYVQWKNEFCDQTIIMKWQEHMGYFDDW